MHRLVHVLTTGAAGPAEGDVADMAGNGLEVQRPQPPSG